MSRLFIRNATTTIPLDDLCPDCGGEDHYDRSAVLKETCKRCGGIGYLPSEAGKVILAFIKKHKAKQIPFPF